MVLTGFVSAGVIAAVSAQQQLKGVASSTPNISGGFTWAGYIPPLAMPLLFIVAWLLVIAA
jgi:hypothetical protein